MNTSCGFPILMRVLLHIIVVLLWNIHLSGQMVNHNRTEINEDQFHSSLSEAKLQEDVTGNTKYLYVQDAPNSKWNNSILPGKYASGKAFLELYDQAYLVVGWYGPSYHPTSWLVKTDINGEMLWNKTFIIDGTTGITPSYIAESDDGSIYCSGGNGTGFFNYDPFVIKLNSCGEKEWCKRFITPQDYDYTLGITSDADKGCTVLKFNTADHTGMINRFQLIHLSEQGQVLWINNLLNSDSSINDAFIFKFLHTSDSGYLLAGYIYCPSPINPSVYYYHPYYMRANKEGLLNWTSIINKTNDNGGKVYSFLIYALSQYIYSFGCKNTVINWPGGYLMNTYLYKLNTNGDTIMTKMTIEDSEGCYTDAIIADSSMFICAVAKDDGGPSWYNYVIKTDTNGNLTMMRKVIESSFPMRLLRTFDGKVLCMVITQTTTTPVDYDTNLYKFNQNLEDDTIYTQPFVYDYLCPHPITNDTIWCNNCDMVGMEELTPDLKSNLKVFPNPANETVTIELPTYRVTQTAGPVFSSTLVSYNKPILAGEIEVFDMFGRLLQCFDTPTGQAQVLMDVSKLKPGMYLLRYLSGNELRGSGKIIVE